MWQERMRDYVEAKRRHDEATRLFHRADRLAWKHLRKRVGDERAYELAGVGLADERMIRAYQEMTRARDALKASQDGCDVFNRIMAFGQYNCINAEPFRPANEA